MNEQLKTELNKELKKVTRQVKAAQSRLTDFLSKQKWVEDARKYAESQHKEVKKILSSDLTRVKSFVERERKHLEKLQKQLPSEVKKIKSFVRTQRKEVERLLTSLRKAGVKKTATRAVVKKRVKRTSRSKTAASASSSKSAS